MAGHWAFTPPTRPTLPAVRDAAWPRNPIDRFLLARLEPRGWTRRPRPTGPTLIRRLTLDLTGLPPTLGEVDAFLGRPGPTPTSGWSTACSPRPVTASGWRWTGSTPPGSPTPTATRSTSPGHWPCRDWVIDAFNRNQPFDRFTVEQVAGDLLPGSTLAAEGRHRLPPEHDGQPRAGPIPRSSWPSTSSTGSTTTATAFLGLTLGCAECHDHKFDPFTQKDFYRFFAFFNGVNEKGVDGVTATPAPMVVPTAEPGRAPGRGPAADRQVAERPPRPRPSRPGRRPPGSGIAGRPAARLVGPRADRAPVDPGGGSTLVEAARRLGPGLGDEPRQGRLRGRRPARLGEHPRLPAGGPGAREPRRQGDRPGRQRQLRPDRLRGRVGHRRPRPDAWSPVPIAKAEADYFQAERRLPGRQGDRRRPVERLGGRRRAPARGSPGDLRDPSPLRLGRRTRLRVRLRFESPFARHAIGRFRLASPTSGRPGASPRPGRRRAGGRAVEADRRPRRRSSGPTSAPRSGPRAGRSARSPRPCKAAEAELEKVDPRRRWSWPRWPKPRADARPDARATSGARGGRRAGRPGEPPAAPARPARRTGWGWPDGWSTRATRWSPG